jgi:hypothetical protein
MLLVDPSIAKTLALKANHLVDLKAAKSDLLSRFDCPNLPEGLWLDVLADRFIDLDKVYSGYYSLESDHKLTESVGNVDITLSSGSGSSKPSRMVQTHGEWSIAFAVAKRAVLYVYPHRADEFSQYEEFIIGQFAAMECPGDHHRVLDLDKAIRVRVARDNKLSLTSFGKFSDLSTRHFVSQRAAPLRESKRPRSMLGGSQPICKRYNGGRCTSDACKYRHLCLLCAGRHAARDCGSAKKGEPPK